MSSPQKLVFLHLSDIHFNKGSGEVYDLDEDLRNELIQDAKKNFDHLGAPAGILISGDIAFSGRKEEYDFAAKWLEELCLAIGCQPTDIFCVPGNHDIDRACVDNERSLFLTHTELRETEAKKIDSTLTKYLKGDGSCNLLLSKLKHYNEFAQRFDCGITKKIFWQTEFSLSENVTVLLHGLNTVICSDRNDHEENGKLLVGSFQTPKSRDGVVNLVMCHHPPDWWKDHESLIGKIEYRSRVLLFGHKHEHLIAPNEHGVSITAGAVHPERDDDTWQPRYNIITLEPNQLNANESHLKLCLYPRVWSQDRPIFECDKKNTDGAEFKEMIIPLQQHEFKKAKPETKSETDSIEQPDVLGPKIIEKNDNRTLVYSFLGISKTKRYQIALDLGLINVDDFEKRDSEIVKTIIHNATSKGKLHDLRARIMG